MALSRTEIDGGSRVDKFGESFIVRLDCKVSCVAKEIMSIFDSIIA
jgi:hypothetical protein